MCVKMTRIDSLTGHFVDRLLVIHDNLGLLVAHHGTTVC
jgi:hypothetical protein